MVLKGNHIAAAVFTLAGAAQLILPQQAIAGDTPNPWTDCGVGALVFGGIKGDAGKILAAVSNITWDLGTTGTSSATSSPSTCRGAETTAAIYIQQNLKVVQRDLAMGGGEHLAAVWSIYGCDAAATDALNAAARRTSQPMLVERSYYSLDTASQAEAVWSAMSSAVAVQRGGTCGT
jgi:hypothetical protein